MEKTTHSFWYIFHFKKRFKKARNSFHAHLSQNNEKNHLQTFFDGTECYRFSCENKNSLLKSRKLVLFSLLKSSKVVSTFSLFFIYTNFIFQKDFKLSTDLLRTKYSLIANLLSVPHLNCLHTFDFLLKLEDAVKKCFCSRWTSGNVNINRDDSVTSTNDGIRVMIISPSVCTRSHWDHPSRLRHLIIHLTQSWCHFVS